MKFQISTKLVCVEQGCGSNREQEMKASNLRKPVDLDCEPEKLRRQK
jgi:hypothetical protein